MRSRFDEQLDLLNKEMITMGALCENAIAMSAKAVAEGDLALIESIPALAEQIGQKEREIESLCLKLLLQQQPVAKDLRIISSALKMVTDMERIGHQSADIAEIVRMANLKVGGDAEEVRNMALAVIKMVSESIDAFVKKDDDMAQAVIAYDDVVDNCFDRVKNLLIGRFSQPEADGEQTIDLLMVAKYFERIGDHAVNIAKWVVFSITGSRG
jgi:phosphate transport system protein